MPDDRNKLNKFWQELKRRKVVKVIILYSTTAFILLQIVSMIIEPLHLPDWTMTLFIVLIVIGFPIAVIFSWIFDVTPEGIEVTVASHKKKEQHPPEKFRKGNIVTNIIIGVLLVIVIILAIPKLFVKNTDANSELYEKSIAVLPFKNDSPDEENTYLVNGMMEEILNKLEKIEDLKVVSRTTVEKYREHTKTVPEIGKELNVRYILEGSGQKVGKRIKLTLQLIEAETDNHIWSNPYQNEVSDENIFELQEDVALSVAEELKAILTPAEIKEVIKNPTENLAAYNLYLRGLEFFNLTAFNTNYGSEEGSNLLLKSKQFFEQAIQLDSTFAEAYVKLGQIYISNLSNVWNIDLSEKYLDSGIVAINKALAYNSNIPFAYNQKALYFLIKGRREDALRAYESEDRLSKKIEEQWQSNFKLFWRYGQLNDISKSLENFYQYTDSKPETELIKPNFYYFASRQFSLAGFPEIAKNYAIKILKHDNDSALYFSRLRAIDIDAGDYNSSIKYHLKRNDQYTNEWDLFNLSRYCFYSRDNKNAQKYIVQMHHLMQEEDIHEPLTWKVNNPYLNEEHGFIEHKYGNKKIATSCFNKTIERCKKEIELNRPRAQHYESHFTLACVYASLGEKEKAMNYLREMTNRKIQTTVQYNQFKNHPALDILRDEPEYKELVKTVESKYLELHNQVGKLIKKYEKT